MTSHSWPVWLQCLPWGRAANPAQYGLAISTLSLGTSWGCQVWLACGAGRSEPLSSSPSCSAHLQSDPPAPCAHYQLCHFPAGSISAWLMVPSQKPCSFPLHPFHYTFCRISATSTDVKSFLTAPVPLLKTDSCIKTAFEPLGGRDIPNPHFPGLAWELRMSDACRWRVSGTEYVTKPQSICCIQLQPRLACRLRPADPCTGSSRG